MAVWVPRAEIVSESRPFGIPLFPAEKSGRFERDVAFVILKDGVVGAVGLNKGWSCGFEEEAFVVVAFVLCRFFVFHLDDGHVCKRVFGESIQYRHLKGISWRFSEQALDLPVGHERRF